MIKELSIGAGLAVIIGLIWAGINLYPLLFVIGLFYLLLITTEFGGGSNKISSFNVGDNKVPQISFEDIGGQSNAKKELMEALEFIKSPQRIMEMGIRPLKGILLAGPPGTGKTLLAKAAAFYTDSAFLAAAGSEFIEMYAGVGAQRVRNLFKQARNLARKKKKKNAILFIDELEILGGKRGSHSSHLEYDQTLNQLLVELDGMQSNEGINLLLIGATNRLDMLDEALLRPGRFDRVVYVDLPDQEARYQILQVHTRNKPLHPEVDLRRVAKETFGFSGAHLESVANESAIIALREKKKLIECKHFNEAIDKVMLGEKLDRRPDKKELRRIAIHEAGHALMSELVRPNSVSSVTIISRGKALGYMRQEPEKDSYLFTKDYLEDQIAILLSGSLSEEILLGCRSTGATGDFHQAIELAKKIIDGGMSALGVVTIKDLPQEYMHQEVQRIIKTQEDKVRNIIEDKKEIILRVSEKLIEEEQVDGAYLRSLI